jgi:hypothetical protein
MLKIVSLVLHSSLFYPIISDREEKDYKLSPGDHEQPAAIRVENASQVWPQGVHLQTESKQVAILKYLFYMLLTVSQNGLDRPSLSSPIFVALMGLCKVLHSGRHRQSLSSPMVREKFQVS